MVVGVATNPALGYPKGIPKLNTFSPGALYDGGAVAGDAIGEE
jgi:hypothetical protein